MAQVLANPELHICREKFHNNISGKLLNHHDFFPFFFLSHVLRQKSYFRHKLEQFSAGAIQ